MKYLLHFKFDVSKLSGEWKYFWSSMFYESSLCEVILIELEKKKGKKKKKEIVFTNYAVYIFILKLVNLHCVTIIPPLNPIQAWKVFTRLRPFV